MVSSVWLAGAVADSLASSPTWPSPALRLALNQEANRSSAGVAG